MSRKCHKRSSTNGYSITSSASNWNSRVIVSPRALAVLRLMTSSNLVGSSTGRSPVNKEGRASEALGAHEAAEGVLGRAYDRLAAHVEAGVDQYGASGQPVKAAEQPAWEPRGGCRAHRQHSTVDRCRGPTSTYQKRDTKKGPRRQQAGMVPPLPNSAHGEQLISAEPRGTARLGWMAPLRHLGARVLVGSSSSTRVSSLRASPITCSISIPTTFANTPRNSVGWPSSVR